MNQKKLLSLFLPFWNLFASFLIVFVFHLFFSGCEKKDPEKITSFGQVQLFIKDSVSDQKSGDLGYIKITVKRSSGENALSDFKIQLTQSENEKVSLPFRLTSGTYFLEKAISFNKAGLPVFFYSADINQNSKIETEIPFKIKPNQLLSLRLTFPNPINEQVQDSIFQNEQSYSTDHLIRLSIHAYNPQLDTLFYINGTVLVQSGKVPVSLGYLEKGPTILAFKMPDPGNNVTLLIKSPSFKDTTLFIGYEKLITKKHHDFRLTLNPMFPVKKQLLVWYPLNGNADDFSGNNHHGKANQVTFVPNRFGRPEMAAKFNKDSHVFLGDILNSVDVPFVINFWIRTTLANPTLKTNLINQGFGYQFSVLISDYLVNEFPYYGFKVNYNNGFLNFQLGDGAGLGYQYRKTVIANKFVADGNWHMVTGVFKSFKNMKIFIDLKPAFQPYLNERVNGKAVRLVHSPYPALLGVGMTGELDDFRIYNYVLSEAQIDSLYHEGGWK